MARTASEIFFRAALMGAWLVGGGPIQPSSHAEPMATSGAGAVGRYPDASDASLAVGPTRQVLLVNDRFRITRRTTPVTNTLLTTGSQNSFAGAPARRPSYANDLIWDAKTNRFYFVVAAWDTRDSYLYYGWSKTRSPDHPDDFCRYLLTFVETKILFPTMGDTSRRFMIGYTRSASATGAFVRSDLLVANKPDEGPACPLGPPATIYSDLKTPTGEKLYGPAPANQIDGSPTGYVVARTAALPSGRLGIIRVTEAGRTGAKLEPFSLAIGHYGAPPPVDQRAAPALDTGDARTTQAVLARVPRNRNAFSLFTQQTVAAGSLPAVDWFELDPEGTPSIRRRGRIRGADFGVFNAAISPNRSVLDGVATGGNDLVVVYNTSSSAFYPRVRASSSIDGAAWTATVLYGASAPFADLSTNCGPGRPVICPWGGASAAPDPLQGKVWATLPAPDGTTPPPTNTKAWRARVYQITP